MIRFISLYTLLLLSLQTFANLPAGYYNNAQGKKEAQLKTALYNIISTDYEQQEYNFLYTIFRESDITADGKIWDMYSHCTWTYGVKQCGSYQNVCDCYNREHSIPQSWFNGQYPMYSDAFHLYPTDGRVNGQRSNYPFGETAYGTTLPMGKGRLGNSTFPGYSGTVFEPVDDYKGDFARTYFYFATRYENIMTTINGESFNKTVYPAFPAWTINLFLKWHRNDPVSNKEITRNNVIYTYQNNRNPFIDHPELVEYIWGDMKGISWVNPSVSVPELSEVSVSFNYCPETKSVHLGNTGQDIRYRILNVSGQVLKSGSTRFSPQISIDGFPSGMYFVRFETSQLKATRKWIIQ